MTNNIYIICIYVEVKIATTLLWPKAEIHDFCTSIPWSFKKRFENIKYLKKLDIPYRIWVIRMNKNKNYIKDIYDFLIKNNIISYTESFNVDDVRPSWKWTNESFDLQENKTTTKPNLNINSNFFHKSLYYNNCWFWEIAIKTNWEVIPCVFSRNLVLWDIRSNSLSNIIEIAEKWIRKTSLDKINNCKDCIYRYACLNCRPSNYDYEENFFEKPFNCWV